MKRILATAITSAALAAVTAVPASADPIRDASCRVQDKLGVENVQDCNWSHQES